MTIEKGNIDQKWKKSSHGLFLEYPSKYNIIALFYCTVHYCVKPKVLTPDGLNVTNMTQGDPTGGVGGNMVAKTLKPVSIWGLI